MQDEGIRDPQDKDALIWVGIDEFNRQVQVAVDELDNAHLVDLRGTMSAEEWYGEIHSDSPGLQQML